VELVKCRDSGESGERTPRVLVRILELPFVDS
jgi:hypothetical protein